MILTLELTKEQANAVCAACELYTRIRIGQFDHIVEHCLDMGLEVDEFIRRRDMAETMLLEARRHIYPELHGIGHSYGVGKFIDADRAWDVHQVLRHALGDERRPFSLRGELPKCKIGE